MTQNGSKKQVRLFILNDPSMLRISPELAVEIGLAESIALLQLEYLIGISTTEERDGELWTYQSLNELRKNYFKFWSRATVGRVMKSLEKQGLIKIGNYNKLKFDHTCWYCLNREGISKLQSVKIETSMYQNETSKRTKRDIEENKTRHQRLKSGHGSTQNETTIPEIPTETSTKNPTEIPAQNIPYGGAAETWAHVVGQLQSEMRASDFRAYVLPVIPIGYDGTLFIVATINRYNADWITSRLGKTITRQLESLYGHPVALEVQTRPDLAA